MATSEIEQSIEDITGISAPSTHSIEDAQRFVVSAIPKEMLWFAATSGSASNANGVSITTADSVISVDRNGYPSTEVPFALSKWLDDDNSLRKATAKHPMHYNFSGKIFIKPDPDSSNSGTVYYIDYSQIDDACDLRNAVTYRACASEFSKLASNELPDILSLLPLAPTTPDDPTISYTNASLGDAVLSAQDSVDSAQDQYTGELSDKSQTAASADVLISHTKPVVESSSGSSLTDTVDSTFGSEADMVSIDKWWDIAGEIIEIEEDAELARAQVEKIQAYIAAFRMELENAKTSMQGLIEDAKIKAQISISNSTNDNRVQAAAITSKTTAGVAKMQASTQASIAKMQQSTTAAIQKMQQSTNVNVQNAAKDLQGSLQNYQLKVQKFQADVGKFQISMTSEIQRYQSKIAKQQAYSKEADKYYLWANNEINTYIKSNLRGRAAMSQMQQQPPPQRQRQQRRR